MTDIVNIVVLSFMVSCWVWRFLVVVLLVSIAVLMSAVIGVVVLSWRWRMVIVVFVLIAVWLLCVPTLFGIRSRRCWFVWVH